MHITVKDQTTGSDATMCVERSTGTCVILGGDIDMFDKLVNMANSLKADSVTILAATPAVAALEALGWKASETVVAMTKLTRRARQ